MGSAPEFAEALGRNISKAATGELTPQQALDQAAEEWVKIVQKLGIDNQKAQYANFINGARKLGYKIWGVSRRPLQILTELGLSARAHK